MNLTRVTRRRARWSVATAIVVAVVLLSAPAALADPAVPTDYRSEVTGLHPPTDRVRVDVLGGDAFLRLRAEPGSEVVVLGYESEPYLRIGADGTVEQNRRSPAVLLNRERYGTAERQPPWVDASAPPEWEVIGHGAEAVWHDHRTHWMGRSRPPQLAGRQAGHVFDWTVPLEVDGQQVEVRGSLHKLPPQSPWPWIAVSAGMAVAVAAAGWRRPVPVAALALAAAALAGATVAAVGELGMPVAAGRRWSLVILPAIAAACALWALRSRSSPLAPVLVLSAALVLPVWIVQQWPLLVRALAPTAPPAGLQRATVTAAVGSVLAASTLLARRRRLDRAT